MGKVVFLSLSVFVLAACNNPKSGSPESTDEQTTENTAIGGDKDEHGCLVAAGETWSELKQSCVQIFDIAQRLNPVNIADGEAVISAFVLLSDDRSKAELFLPDREGTVILDKGEGETYQKDSIKFDAAASVLYIGDEIRYQAE